MSALLNSFTKVVLIFFFLKVWSSVYLSICAKYDPKLCLACCKRKLQNIACVRLYSEWLPCGADREPGIRRRERVNNRFLIDSTLSLPQRPCTTAKVINDCSCSERVNDCSGSEMVTTTVAIMKELMTVIALGKWLRL